MAKTETTKPFYNSTIPSDWEVKKLKEILIEGKLGGNYENAEANNGIPVIKMGNLGRGAIKIDKIQCLPENEAYSEKTKWKLIHIANVSKEVSIKNKDDKALTVLSCTKYDGLVPSLEYFGRKIFSDDLSTYKIVPKNHFAYATNHIEEGSIGYQDKLDEALISPMYTVFKTDASVNNNFFFKLLKSYRCVSEYQTRMEGSIDRRGGLRWDAFSIIKIYLPSIEEQGAIVQVLKAADKEIQLLKTKTKKLREQKKGLMQILLTGKKRLKI